MSRDERLRLSRRIDWRFLLPSPDLGRVGVIGQPDEDLREALRAESLGADALHGALDTVVVTGRIDRGSLARAVGALAPGGRLVVEVTGPGPRSFLARRANAPGTAVRIARALAAGGFDRVTMWLTWPDVARAHWWVRLDDRAAIGALVGRRVGTTRAASVAARVMARTAATSTFASLVPAATIIASRDEAPGLLEKRLAEGVNSSEGHAPGLLVLSPRFRASAHVVALALDDSTGSVARVAKVARLPDDTSLDAEAAALAALGRAVGDTGRHPMLIDAPGLPTDVGGNAWPLLVETAVAGTSLSPAVVRADRRAAVDGIVGWLRELPVSDASTRVTPIPDRLTAALSVIERVAGGRPELRSLVDRSRPIAASLGSMSLPRVFEHGDAAHPNLLRTADGRVGAVDWERGEPDGLPLHDLTMALAYLAAADRNATNATDQAAAYRDAMAGADPWAADALAAEGARIGIDEEARAALVVCAWLRTVAWLAERLGANAPTVDWLVGDRSVAYWRAALDLANA